MNVSKQLKAASQCQAHLVVVARTEEDVVGGWVPLDQANAPAVPVELQDGLCHVAFQASVRDFPYPNLEGEREQKAVAGPAGSPAC